MCHHQMHMQEAPQNCQPLIDVNIVRQLIDLRFPQWAGPSLYEYQPSPESDTSIENRNSQEMHIRLGFVEAERVVYFKRKIE